MLWRTVLVKVLTSWYGYVYHGSMTVSQTIPPEGSHPWPTHQNFPWIFSQYYELWMGKDLHSLQSCAEKHCLWTDWQSSHKVVNHNPSFLATTKPLVDAVFIRNLDNITCYQLPANCGTFQNSVICNLFSPVLPLSQLFLSALQASHSIIFCICIIQLGLSMKRLMFSLYIYQLNKHFNRLQFLVFIEFLESVPTFMEMGFVDTQNDFHRLHLFT